MKRSFLMAAVVLVVLGGAAQAQWTRDGKLVEETSWSQSKEGFGVFLGITDQPKALQKAWSKPGKYVPISMPSEIRRGATVSAFLVFSGCPGKEDGKCDVVADLEIVDPRGTILAQLRNVEFWNGPAPEPPKIQLATTGLGGKVHGTDPLGEYIVRVVVKDRVKDLRFLLERRYTVK